MTRADMADSLSAQPLERISAEQALSLLTDGDTAELMERADQIRRRLHGPNAYFVHSLNLNPTNICENRCELCAFWREDNDSDAYLVTLDQARRILHRAMDLGITELHVVGGVTAKLGLEYYQSLFRLAKELMPSILIQGMTAVEVHYLADREGLSVGEVIRRLIDAGLGAIPGGGAEIFAEQVRDRICSQKISAEQWLAVHRQAHELDLPTNATMLFGHIETPEDIVDHLMRLRDMQDRTGGFNTFIPLPFHAEGTNLSLDRSPGGHKIVRVVALARIFLDNFPHIRVLANYIDRKLLEVLAFSGIDDFGGTSLDERIARAAGAPDDRKFASIQEMTEFLDGLSLQPVLTNSIYESVRIVPVEPSATPAASESESVELADALACAQAGRRLSARQAVILHDEAPFQRLGRLAQNRRMQAAANDTTTFVLDRNISITNVCETGCKFCAFHVEEGSDESFVLSVEQILEKVAEATELGATQILLQGGLNRQLDLAFYERMLSSIKREVNICLHSLSPAEVLYLARGGGLSIAQTLERLAKAGLDSLPGGGAEILVDDVRSRVSPRKITTDEWLEVMETAHGLGMKTTATMVYGLGETTAQRVEHLMRIRDLQDQTGGFTAFIPWSFQPNRTQLDLKSPSGVDYLRVVALARLVLDNIPHIQAGWVTEGPDVAQLALSFGADDFGGVLMEELVVRATGVHYSVTRDQVVSLIRETNMKPAQRTTQYEIVRCFDEADSAT